MSTVHTGSSPEDAGDAHDSALPQQQEALQEGLPREFGCECKLFFGQERYGRGLAAVWRGLQLVGKSNSMCKK